MRASVCLSACKPVCLSVFYKLDVSVLYIRQQIEDYDDDDHDDDHDDDDDDKTNKLLKLPSKSSDLFFATPRNQLKVGTLH